MKSKFIYFGILAAMISNAVFATNQNHQQNNTTAIASVSESNTNTLKKPALAIEADAPITITAIYKKTIEEVIAEDNKIIESDIENNTTSAIESTMKKVIMEDNQIIESDINYEVFPLNFENLNKSKTKF